MELQCRRVKRNGSRVLPSVVHKRVDEIVLHLHAHDTSFHNTELVKGLKTVETLPCSFVTYISSNTFGVVIGRIDQNVGQWVYKTLPVLIFSTFI